MIQNKHVKCIKIKSVFYLTNDIMEDVQKIKMKAIYKDNKDEETITLDFFLC